MRKDFHSIVVHPFRYNSNIKSLSYKVTFVFLELIPRESEIEYKIDV